MAGLVFTDALGRIDVWTTGTIRALLVKSTYTFDSTDIFVSDITPATYEISAAGYSRQTLASKTRTVATGPKLVYAAADPSFGTLATGQTIGGMILYEFITNDAASPLLAFYPVAPTATSGVAYSLRFSAAGALFIRNLVT